MKKTTALFLACLVLFAMLLSAYADVPVTGSELPSPGSSENGNVLIDYELAKISVLRTRYLSNDPQYAVDLLIENKSGSDFYVTGSSTAAVDGYVFESYCRQDVPAGELRVATYYIVSEDFHYPGITTPQEIKFNIAFFDTDSTDLLDIAFFAIYPSGLTAEKVVYTPISNIGYSDMEYYDEDTGCGFRIIDSKKQETGDFYQIDILLENNSNEQRVFSWHDVKVEGQETEPDWYAGVSPGSCMVSHIYIDTLPLKLKDPNGPASIEFIFTIDNWEATLLQKSLSYAPSKG